MRTTAGMQEVEQRSSSCRGATLSRLVSLVPKARANLTRFHGVFAPNSKYRSLVTPARRGKGNKTKATNEMQDQTPAEKREFMTWAMRLKKALIYPMAPSLDAAHQFTLSISPKSAYFF